MNSINSMGAVFTTLGNLLPAPLTGPLAREVLVKKLAGVPFTLGATAFGFETTLGVPDREPGFAFCIPRSKAASFLAAGTGFTPVPAWGERLERLLAAWISGPLGPVVENLWLEWDDLAAPASRLPKIFFTLSQAASPRLLMEILHLCDGFHSHSEFSTLDGNLGRVLEKLTSQSRLAQLGAAVVSGTPLIRLCLKGISLDSLITLDPAFRAPGIRASLEGLGPLSANPVFHLDLGTGLLPRLGMELRLPYDDLVPARQELWDGVLEKLEHRGLCLAEEREALGRWHGRSWELSPPLLSGCIVNRLVYYLKAVSSRAGTPVLKAYWGFMTVPLSRFREDKPWTAAAACRAVDFLQQRQLPWGEWPTYKSNTPRLADPVADSTVFTTTFIMDCLSGLPGKNVRKMLARGAEFLNKERLAGNLWAYWSSRADRKIIPDLDDTCCVSFILEKCRAGSGAGRENRRILTNRDPATRLFHTWVAAPGETNDVDLAVNTNVLLYLGESGETRATIDFIIDTIRGGREADYSYYYLSPTTLYYMVSRAFGHGITAFGRLAKTITTRLLANQNIYGVWSDPLYTALSLITLLNFGFSGKGELLPAINYLLDS